MKEHNMGQPARAIPPVDAKASDAIAAPSRPDTGLRLVAPVLNTSHEEQSPFVPANRN